MRTPKEFNHNSIMSQSEFNSISIQSGFRAKRDAPSIIELMPLRGVFFNSMDEPPGACPPNGGLFCRLRIVLPILPNELAQLIDDCIYSTQNTLTHIACCHDTPSKQHAPCGYDKSSGHP